MLLKLAKKAKNNAAIVIQSIWRIATAKQILEEKLLRKNTDAVISFKDLEKLSLPKKEESP